MLSTPSLSRSLSTVQAVTEPCLVSSVRSMSLYLVILCVHLYTVLLMLCVHFYTALIMLCVHLYTALVMLCVHLYTALVGHVVCTLVHWTDHVVCTLVPYHSYRQSFRRLELQDVLKNKSRIGSDLVYSNKYTQTHSTCLFQNFYNLFLEVKITKTCCHQLGVKMILMKWSQNLKKQRKICSWTVQSRSVESPGHDPQHSAWQALPGAAGQEGHLGAEILSADAAWLFQRHFLQVRRLSSYCFDLPPPLDILHFPLKKEDLNIYGIHILEND